MRMLGGINENIVRSYGGGPCLPYSGVGRTELTQRSFNGVMAAPLLKPISILGINPFEEVYDFWPVPVTWIEEMFSQEMWSARVFQFGKSAVGMGPLTWGSRQHSRVHTRSQWWSDDRLESLWNFTAPRPPRGAPRMFFQPSFDIRLQAARIKAAVLRRPGDADSNEDSNTTLNVNNQSTPVPIQYNCPDDLWDRILAFFNKNRNPLQLGLDTMGYVSESIFTGISRNGRLILGHRLWKNKSHLWNYDAFCHGQKRTKYISGMTKSR